MSCKIDLFTGSFNITDADKEDLLAKDSDVLRTCFLAEYRSLASGARASITLSRLLWGEGGGSHALGERHQESYNQYLFDRKRRQNTVCILFLATLPSPNIRHPCPAIHRRLLLGRVTHNTQQEYISGLCKARPGIAPPTHICGDAERPRFWTTEVLCLVFSYGWCRRIGEYIGKSFCAQTVPKDETIGGCTLIAGRVCF